MGVSQRDSAHECSKIQIWHGTAEVHVVRVSKSGYVDRQGRRRDYSSAYLRRTCRSEGKVKNETVANLSALPEHVIDLIDRADAAAAGRGPGPSRAPRGASPARGGPGHGAVRGTGRRPVIHRD